MTVQELIEELNYVNSDAQIRFASQPNWPLEYSFSGPVEVGDEDGFPTVYLVEGSQLGYLPKEAKDEIGW
jgi:hypothetical protein